MESTALYNTLMGNPGGNAYNAIGRTYGSGNVNANNPLGFFQKRANSVENAIGTTLMAPVSGLKDTYENWSTAQRRRDWKGNIDDVYRKYGFRNKQDFDDQLYAAEDAGNDEEANRLLNLAGLQQDLQAVANSNAAEAKSKAKDYNAWRTDNSYLNQKINQDEGKFAGSAINTLSTATDVLGLTNGPLGNAIQGGIEGVADELEQNGLRDFSWERAGQNALSGAVTGAATGAFNKALGGTKLGQGQNLFKGGNKFTKGLNDLGSKTALGRLGSSMATGAARGALSGAIGGATGGGLQAAMNNQDVLGGAFQGALQGAKGGAVSGAVMTPINSAIGNTNLMKNVRQAQQNWKNSGKNFGERFENTLNSGDSAVGNFGYAVVSDLMDAWGGDKTGTDAGDGVNAKSGYVKAPDAAGAGKQLKYDRAMALAKEALGAFETADPYQFEESMTEMAEAKGLDWNTAKGKREFTKMWLDETANDIAGGGDNREMWAQSLEDYVGEPQLANGVNPTNGGTVENERLQSIIDQIRGFDNDGGMKTKSGFVRPLDTEGAANELKLDALRKKYTGSNFNEQDLQSATPAQDAFNRGEGSFSDALNEFLEQGGNIVRNADGTMRLVKPGETGEISDNQRRVNEAINTQRKYQDQAAGITSDIENQIGGKLARPVNALDMANNDQFIFLQGADGQEYTYDKNTGQVTVTNPQTGDQEYVQAQGSNKQYRNMTDPEKNLVNFSDKWLDGNIQSGERLLNLATQYGEAGYNAAISDLADYIGSEDVAKRVIDSYISDYQPAPSRMPVDTNIHNYDDLVDNLRNIKSADQLEQVAVQAGFKNAQEFMNNLTNDNYHTERTLANAIMTGDQNYIDRARQILDQSDADGYLTQENLAARNQLTDDMRQNRIMPNMEAQYDDNMELPGQNNVRAFKRRVANYVANMDDGELRSYYEGALKNTANNTNQAGVDIMAQVAADEMNSRGLLNNNMVDNTQAPQAQQPYRFTGGDGEYWDAVDSMQKMTTPKQLQETIKNLGYNNTGEFLNQLTDENYHTERVLAEALMTGNPDYIERAKQIRAQHLADGSLTTENAAARRQLQNEIDNYTPGQQAQSTEVYDALANNEEAPKNLRAEIIKNRIENTLGKKINFEYASDTEKPGWYKSFRFIDEDGNRYYYDASRGIYPHGVENAKVITSQAEQAAMNDAGWKDEKLTGAKIKKILKNAGFDTNGLSIKHQYGGYSDSWDIDGDGTKVDLPAIERILKNKLQWYETDERSGEILAGGNTFVFANDSGDYENNNGGIKTKGGYVNTPDTRKARQELQGMPTEAETELYRQLTSQTGNE